MNLTRRMPAALAVLAVSLIGCGQQPEGPTADTPQATTPAAAQSSTATDPADTSPRPSATGTGESAVVVPGEVTICAPINAELRSGTEEQVVRLSIEVPAGWANTQFEGMIHYLTPSNGHWPWIGLLWTFNSIADDPCAASAAPVGPSVDDLVEGLTTIPGTDAGEPSDTTIGGVPATFVELTINDDIACAPNEFYFYGPDSAWPNSLDSTIRVWVFELDGTRYVIHSDQVGDDPRIGDMILDVVESIEFE